VNRKYDLFIALQVWEHLGSVKQKQDAFREAMRVSKTALLSFPYMWDCSEGDCHRMISEEIIKEWTLGVEPLFKKLVGVYHKRIFYYYKF
jgi:hypothetical protein